MGLEDHFNILVLLRLLLLALWVANVDAFSNDSMQKHGNSSIHHDCSVFIPNMDVWLWTPGIVTTDRDGRSATPTVPTNADGTHIATITITTAARLHNGKWQALTGTSIM
jgi:hypothetical protein